MPKFTTRSRRVTRRSLRQVLTWPLDVLSPTRRRIRRRLRVYGAPRKR
jgi:hypothetical protein